MACSSSCLTQDHATWGECVRSKNLRTAYMQEWKGQDYTAQKRWDSELSAYKKARDEGIQPHGTSMKAVQEAVAVSDKGGVAYDPAKIGPTDYGSLK